MMEHEFIQYWLTGVGIFFGGVIVGLLMAKSK